MNCPAGAFLRATVHWPISILSRPAPRDESDPHWADGAEDRWEPFSDEELANRVALEPDAFIPLYRRYFDRILNYLNRLARDRDVAEDLTSKTFLSAFEALRRQRRDVRFSPWIYRIATNAHISHRRSLARRVRCLFSFAQDRAAMPCPEADLPYPDERAAAARAALLRLPDKYRVAIVMRFDEELSYEDIAQSLGLTTGAARSRVSRGLALLRRRLKPLMENWQ